MRYAEDDLAAAAVTLLVLAILAKGENFGFAILKRVRQAEGRELAWPDAMVYPLLHRLRRRGYLTTEWRTTPDGRRRRYYVITAAGLAELERVHPQAIRAAPALSRRRRGTDWRLAAPLAAPA